MRTYVCSNLQTFLLQTWNFDRNGKLYSHTQDNHCIRITALPQPRFSRLAVGWAATAGGGAGLAIFVICGLVYLKKQRLACCGQYSGVAPKGKEEDEIVGYTELEVNRCDWPMEHRQVHTYIHTCSHHQWTHSTLMEHTYIRLYVYGNPVPRTYVRTCVHTYVCIQSRVQTFVSRNIKKCLDPVCHTTQLSKLCNTGTYVCMYNV